LKALKSRTGFGIERREAVSASAVYKQHVDKAAGRLGRTLEERVADSGAYTYSQHDKRLNRAGIPLGLVKTASGTTEDSPSRDREAGHSDLGDLIAAVDPPCSDPVECGMHSAELEIELTDIGYFCEAFFGTPPRRFKLLVDTGSADLWVPGENCRGYNESTPGCGPHASIGHNSSSSFRDTQDVFFIVYGSGHVLGLMATDHLSIANLTVENFRFGATEKESRSVISANIPWDGILGLAQPDLARQPNGIQFIDALMNTSQISEPITSFKIPRHLDAEKEGSEGEMTIGGMNPEKYHEDTVVTMKNVNNKGFWEAPIDGLSINGFEVEWVTNNRSGVLDTGTSLVVMPPSDAYAIHSLIPGAHYDGKFRHWTVPCTANTSMSIGFGGTSFWIDPRDLVFDVPINETTCYSGIAEGDLGLGETVWLVGDTILKNVYLSLNRAKDEISMAELKE
ncbi:hypothetical protein PQX77_008382, partial [Marasmius sp. AFHP31]